MDHPVTTFDIDLANLVRQQVEANEQVDRAAGTVSTFTPGTARAMAQFDGSSLAVPVKVMGNVRIRAGDRVGLIRVGSDWVIFGTLNVARLIEGYAFTRAGTLATAVGATEVALTAWEGVTIPTYRNGRLYSFEGHGFVYDTGSSGNGSLQTVLFREQLNNSGSTLLASVPVVSLGGSIVVQWSHTSYAKNTSGLDVAVANGPGLSITKTLGVGSSSLYADSAYPTELIVTDIGSLDDPALANLVARATPM